MIQLHQFELENFRGCKHYEHDFGGRSAAVYGANYIGKSTLADAFFWLLTGKDQQDRADYKILPTGSAEGVEASASAGITLEGGGSVTLRRVYKPVFTRKRGEAEKRRTGSTTDYYIDDVPKKAGEYADYIKEHFGREEDILTVTRPDYFAQVMKPDVRRQKLLDLFAGGVNDMSVIARHKELAPLGEKLGTYTVDDCAARWKANRRKVSEELKALPGRMDEAERAKPDTVNLDTDSARLPHLVSQRIQIRKKIDALRSGESVSMARSKISKLQADMEQARGEYLRKSSGGNDALENQIAALRQETANLQDKLAQHSGNLNRDNSRIDALNKEIPALRQAVVTEHSRQFDTSSGVCPTCGRPYPQEKVNELEGSFNEQKAQKITGMQQQGQDMVQELNGLTKSRDAAVQDIKDINFEIGHHKQKIYGLQKMLVTPPAWEETKECAGWRTKVEAAQKELYDAEHEADAQIQKLQEELNPVESEISGIQQKQADAELIKKQDARIAELKEQQKKLGIRLAQLDSMLHLTELFVQLKAADVEAEVNGSFRTVRWKLFETQVNGGVKACCEAQVSGKDYGSLSKSEKVNAGLDIVDTLGRKMGLVMPVWHDDAESVSHPLKIGAQTISLYVSDKDKTLRTEVLE